jgi:hypothetical protein
MVEASSRLIRGQLITELEYSCGRAEDLNQQQQNQSAPSQILNQIPRGRKS